MIKQVFLSFFALLVMTSYVLAQEESEKLETLKYSPDYCQFTASFPEEPNVSHRCEGETEDTCYNLISYTKVIDLSSTVSIEIICNPTTPGMYEEFTEEVMDRTVRAMTSETVIQTYEVNTRQGDGYRQTSLVGQGRKGLYDTIYMAQLWVADGSIMSVEAELSGENNEAADALFASILRTIGFTKEINAPAQAQTETEETTETAPVTTPAPVEAE